MRINKWIAHNATIGRRRADNLISLGKVSVNDVVAVLGQDVDGSERITINGEAISQISNRPVTILLHKPAGYVSSRDGQGSRTVYDLLPQEYSHLKMAGRLDKDSTGLVILSSDGKVIQALTHPTLLKKKVYMLKTAYPLTRDDVNLITTRGVDIGDNRPSVFSLTVIPNKKNTYRTVLYEGRNRQIRRTVEALGNHVVSLHRLEIGEYSLHNLAEGNFKQVVVK